MLVSISKITCSLIESFIASSLDDSLVLEVVFMHIYTCSKLCLSQIH